MLTPLNTKMSDVPPPMSATTTPIPFSSCGRTAPPPAAGSVLAGNCMKDSAVAGDNYVTCRIENPLQIIGADQAIVAGYGDDPLAVPRNDMPAGTSHIC